MLSVEAFDARSDARYDRIGVQYLFIAKTFLIDETCQLDYNNQNKLVLVLR